MDHQSCLLQQERGRHPSWSQSLHPRLFILCGNRERPWKSPVSWHKGQSRISDNSGGKGQSGGSSEPSSHRGTDRKTMGPGQKQKTRLCQMKANEVKHKVSPYIVQMGEWGRVGPTPPHATTEARQIPKPAPWQSRTYSYCEQQFHFNETSSVTSN